MSTGISNSDLVDLQRTTLENLPNMEFETALRQQEFPVVNQWFQKDKIQEDNGTSISRRIMLDNSGNARHVRLYQKSSINQGNALRPLTAPWVQVEGQYSIERREALRNRKPAMYIKLLETRRLDSMLAMAYTLEDRGWVAPENSSDDLFPRGLPYYLSKLVPSTAVAGYDSAIDVAGTFAGRRIIWHDGTFTLTDKSGIDPTAQGLWRNYVDTITGIDGAAIKKLAKAFYATKFTAPITVTDLKSGPASKYRIYMTLNDMVEYDDLARKSNDNLGADLAKFHGISAFNRVPIQWSPNLDADTSLPIYGVNHAKFFPIVMEGDWMRENEPMIDPELHNVIVTFVDGSYQYFNTNIRESGFVIHRALAL